MMDRISICETLAKRNEIDPFLKRMVIGNEKWVPYYNIVRKRSWSKCGEAAQTVANPGLTTMKKIGKIVSRTHSSIQRVINNYTSSKSVISKPCSGRPSKLTLREKRYVFKSIRLNLRLSASQIVNGIRERFKKTLHENTIRKILKKAGYHGRVAHKKPHISAVNTQKRLDFANEHVNKPPQFWEKVLLSDESKFCIFGIKGRKLVWQKQGTALEKENLVPAVKHGGGGVMVWGCMAANGVGRLTFID
ncbi:transposable element Tcb1 transposase [Trichonephila clavipes]|uniref:Transposable element Tcb1 transposase n=1 Tax=Trichonephila clavipes TaxID=2585209 RepID=A0A8X6RGT6_TRICX|nr:transposable element Tcb1 transposase [Trichonephila clavipes]